MYYEIVYDMSVNVNVIYYVHVCEQAHWACSAGNSAIENLCIIIIIIVLGVLKIVCGWANKTWFLLYACCGLHFTDSAAYVLSFYAPPLHYTHIGMNEWVKRYTWEFPHKT